MAFKFVFLALSVAAAHGSGIGAADYTSFSYGVSDPHTGDVKSQHETRSGGNVVGQYSLLESDGTRRTVDYAADDHSGFNAVVRKDPALIAAPAVVTTPASLGYAANWNGANAASWNNGAWNNAAGNAASWNVARAAPAVVATPVAAVTPVVSAVNWDGARASWNGANDASWNGANDASWNGANDASWNGASWNAASWNAASWNGVGVNADIVAPVVKAAVSVPAINVAVAAPVTNTVAYDVLSTSVGGKGLGHGSSAW